METSMARLVRMFRCMERNPHMLLVDENTAGRESSLREAIVGTEKLSALLRVRLNKTYACLAAFGAEVFGTSTGWAQSAGAQTRITSVTASGGKVVVRWEGGTGPYQLQRRQTINGVWQNVGGLTSARSATNLMEGSTSFYRVASTTENYNVSGGQLQWLRSSSPDKGAHAKCIRTDRAGNVIVVGEFWGTVDMGGASITAPAAYQSGFLAKYGSDGRLQWAKTLGGGTGNDCATAVAIDSQDNIVVVGDFYSPTLDLGGGLIINNYTTTRDVFVVK